jgi:HCO3- transporter family
MLPFTLFIREQRVTGVAIHTLIGLSTLLTSVLQVIFCITLKYACQFARGRGTEIEVDVSKDFGIFCISDVFFFDK